jgi:hypothetical protein
MVAGQIGAPDGVILWRRTARTLRRQVVSSGRSNKLVRATAFLLPALLIGAPDRASAFAIFTVGAGCPYATIQEALTAAYYSPGEDYVWIANNTTYTGQHITVGNQDVDIEGGFTDCNDFTIEPNDTTTVSGAGNDGGPVFEITGNGHVYLGNLVISGAQRGAATNGGGVSFIGQGALTLANTTIYNNQAGTGGGVYVEQAGGDVSLTLLANTQIYFNSADGDGGGIALVGYKPGTTGGNALLYADSADTWIAFNDAGGNGGGLFVKWFANANIGSPGYGGLGVLYNNSALNGGAIAISSPDGYSGTGTGPMVTLYTTNPAHPVRLQSNTAAQFGGAVYVKAGPQLPQSNAACFVAFNFRIDDSIAPEGAAIYTEPNGGMTNVLFNRFVGCYQLVSHFPNQACAAGTICNSVDGNGALDSLGDPTDGATILFQTLGELQVERVSLRGNLGGNVVHGIGDSGNAGMFMNDVLIADSTMSAELLKFDGPASTQYAPPIRLLSSTLTHNAIGSANVIHVQHNFNLYDSIIDQPGKAMVDFAGPVASHFNASGNLVSDTSTLPSGSTQGTPTFVDAASGNYRLTPWSLGVDFNITNYTVDEQDLDGNARIVDLTSIPNVTGNTRDVGAYEVQYVCAADEVFCSGFDH